MVYLGTWPSSGLFWNWTETCFLCLNLYSSILDTFVGSVVVCLHPRTVLCCSHVLDSLTDWVPSVSSFRSSTSWTSSSVQFTCAGFSEFSSSLPSCRLLPSLFGWWSRVVTASPSASVQSDISSGFHVSITPVSPSVHIRTVSSPPSLPSVANQWC